MVFMSVLLKKVLEIYTNAAKDLGDDLRGSSIIDLCLDNTSSCYGISDIRSAIVQSNIITVCSPRIRKQIWEWKNRGVK